MSSVAQQTSNGFADAHSIAVLAPVSVIPQRAPFLFLDAITEGEPGSFAISHYKIKPEHPVFLGHFPDTPVWPGVLLIENMAQTACWVMAAQQNEAASEKTMYVLARVTQCTFKRMVLPNDVLRTHAKLSRDLGQFCTFICEIHIGTEIVAHAELLVARRHAESKSESE